MKLLGVCSVLAVSAGALAQKPSLLAHCFGEPISAYGKAFKNPHTSVQRIGAHHILMIFAHYKTPEADIKVTQAQRSPAAEFVVVNFRRAPALSWQKALAELGISSAGVHSTFLGEGRLELSDLKGPSGYKVTAIYSSADKANQGNPTVLLSLKSTTALPSRGR